MVKLYLHTCRVFETPADLEIQTKIHLHLQIGLFGDKI